MVQDPAQARHGVAGPPAFFSTQVRGARRFYGDLAPNRRAGLVVVCGGREECMPTYRIHRTDFPFYSVEYVVAGRGQLALQGVRTGLEPGDVFSYGPGVAHEIETSAETPLVKYFVDFAGRGARGLLRRCGLWPPRLVRVHPPTALQGLFEELIEAGLTSGRAGGVMARLLLECLSWKLRVMSSVPASSSPRAFLTWQRCCALIQEEHARLRSVTDVARACHVDAAYLCRLFRRFSGQTPYQYLLRRKLEAAAARLSEPGALVKEVALEAGFSDPFHFSRVFKRVFGVAPSVFRAWRAGVGRVGDG